VDFQGDQEIVGYKRMEGGQEERGTKGFSRGPGENRNSEDGGDKKDEGPEGKRDQEDCQGGNQWGTRRMEGIKRKEKKTKRIDKGTQEGPEGWRGKEGKRGQEDCERYQHKIGTRRIERIRRKEWPRGLPRNPKKRGTRRMERARRRERPRGLQMIPAEKRDQEDREE
jgi:hypothetical protein